LASDTAGQQSYNLLKNYVLVLLQVMIIVPAIKPRFFMHHFLLLYRKISVCLSMSKIALASHWLEAVEPNS